MRSMCCLLKTGWGEVPADKIAGSWVLLLCLLGNRCLHRRAGQPCSFASHCVCAQQNCHQSACCSPLLSSCSSRIPATSSALKAEDVVFLQVALKRIADVLSSPDQAKRVLREVCILRRLRHPFLINLRDTFTRPASSGARQLWHLCFKGCGSLSLQFGGLVPFLTKLGASKIISWSRVP